MSLPDYFRKLVVWDAWANTRLSVAARPHYNASEEIRREFSHFLNAEKLLLDRARELPPSPEFDINEVRDFHEITLLIGRRQEEWLGWLRTQTDDSLAKVVEFQNLKGETRRCSRSGLVTQMLHHSTHHRARIALLLRGLGAVPPENGYMHYEARQPG